MYEEKKSVPPAVIYKQEKIDFVQFPGLSKAASVRLNKKLLRFDLLR